MVLNVEPYLKESIDDNITIKPWLNKKIFPVSLRNQYNFYETKMLGTPCILVGVADEMPAIDKIKKHMKQIEAIADRQIVFLYKEISRYRRKSLIKNRIPFVIENGQMYLPFLAMDLKMVKENIDSEVKRFTTSAQIAFLYFLYHKNEVVNVSEFAEKMGIANMTASRALNELYHANLITYEIGGKTGRSKKYRRIQDPGYFLKGQGHLKSPVKKIIYTKSKPLNALNAGLVALAELSMINPPGYSIVAMHEEQFNSQKIEIIKNKDIIKDKNMVELQLWDYEPKRFSDKHHVDPLSLYASLKEENDERIEQALEEVLRGEPWYTD